MGAAMVPMAIASTVLNVAGNVSRGNAAVTVAKRKQAEDEYQAQQLDTNAGQERAAGQIAALNQDRNTSLVLSRARAVAAASGGGASDPTVINLMAQIAGEGAYRSNVARYNGESQARTMNMQADSLRYSGNVGMADARQARSASMFGAVTSAISGAAGTYDMGQKYGWGATQAAAPMQDLNRPWDGTN